MAYDNPAGLIAAAVVVQVMVYTFVVLRVYARLKLSKRLITSDWLILVGTLCATGLAVVQIYGCSVHSFGEPYSEQLAPKSVKLARLYLAERKLQFIYTLLGLLGSSVIKFSVCFFYHFIFSTKIYRRIINGWMIILFAWACSVIFSHIFTCGRHFHAYLNGPNEKIIEYCILDPRHQQYLFASDAVTNLITLVIPIPMIWSLHLPLRKRLFVLGIFMVGLLAVGASIGRAYITIKASISTNGTMDPITLQTANSTWNLIENQIGIIAACAPTLQPVLRMIAESGLVVKIMSSIRSRKSTASSTSVDRHNATDARSDRSEHEKASHGSVVSMA